MKQFLQRMLNLLKQVASLLASLLRPVVTLLRSVNVDQPRGVILCVALQVLIVLSLALALHRPTPHVTTTPAATENPPGAPAAEIEPALR